MKLNPMTVASILATALCVALLITQNRAIHKLQSEARDEHSGTVDVSVRTASHLDQSGHGTLLLKKTPQVFDHSSSRIANFEEPTIKHSSMAGIFKDEAMRGLLHDEVKLGVARNVKNLMESGLVEGLSLTPAQARILKCLVEQRSSLMWNKFLVPLATGEVSDSEMASAGKILKSELEDNTARIQALLGDNGYQTYQWYEKSASERERFEQVMRSFSDSGNTLNPAQKQQLLNLMAEQRNNAQFKYDLGSPETLDFEHWRENFTDEKINSFVSDMQDLNERIEKGSENILAPEQAQVLRRALSTQFQRARLTIKFTTAAISP